ncbi:hypothetical protein QL996_09450 [Planococcus sp. APC 4015]|nr:hypothetical protein [Planococcus sp. APC 4015]
MRRTTAAALTIALATTFAVASVGAAHAAPPAMVQTAVLPTDPGTFVSLDPARILDTRVGNGAPQGPVASNGNVTLQVTGRGGVPTTGVSAVVVNVTATGPNSGGFVTVYPTGTTQPTASNVNYTANQSIPNLVTVKVGTSGRVNLANNAPGTVHLIADVAGYYLAGTVTQPGAFVSVDPARVLDTRVGNGAAQTPVGSNGTVGLQITGRGGVPGSGVSAVVVNVTVTSPTAGGFVTVYPSGTTQPTASNLNFRGGQSVPNLVTVKVGTDGKINLTNNSSGSVNLIADVAGYYLAGSPTAPGAFVSVNPARVLDTRSGVGAGAYPLEGYGGYNWVGLQVVNRGGVPTTGVAAVVANVTVTAPSSAGFVTVFPYGSAEPVASNLNYTAGQNVPNLVTVKVGGNGKIDLTNNSSGTTHLIADVAGYFLADPSDVAQVWPTGWVFDDCGTGGDGLLMLDSPGLVYSNPGQVYLFEGEYYYEFLPNSNGEVFLTVSAASGYEFDLDQLPGWTVNGNGSVSATFVFTNVSCGARMAPMTEQPSEGTVLQAPGSVERFEGVSPLTAGE